MAPPLYYKADRDWPARIYSGILRRRGIVLGSLAVVVIGMLCTTLLVGTWAVVGEASSPKRGVEDGDGLIRKDSNRKRSLPTATPDIDDVESPIDLLGGLTGVMSNFYVGQATITPSSPTPVPAADSFPVSATDPLAVLSAAFQKAIANGELLKHDTKTDKKNLESRGDNRDIQDSIVWAGQPSLLSMLSGIVEQVCVIDSGAGARLVDTILETLPVNSTGIASIIPGVAQYSSVSATDILPFVLPAIATVLGKHLEPPHISDTQNTDGIMANIIWHGGIFVNELISSRTYLASTELYDVLNQVAGLMCAAADHLRLPICTVSKQISGTRYEIVIPCGCTGSQPPSAVSQPPQSYVQEETLVTSATGWTVRTMSPTGGYSFTPFPWSSLPPKYEKAPSYSTMEVPGGNMPAQSIQPYGQQPQTSCTSTLLPPAYSTRSLPISASHSAEPCVATPTVACPVCSCASEAPQAYSSPPGSYGTTEKSEQAPPIYGHEGEKPTSSALPTSEGCTESLSQSTEPTTTNDGIPEYSKQSEEPSQSPDSYKKNYSLPGTNSYYSSPRDWRYLGCFRDARERVVVGGGPEGFFRGDVSNRKCMEFCKSRGFSVAGTEDGQECWCGHSIAGDVQLLPATACSKACKGDGLDYCGGSWAISIYTNQAQNQEKPRYKSLAELLALI